MNRYFAPLLACLFHAIALAQTATITPVTSTYAASGGTMVFNVELSFPGGPTAVGLQIGSVPAGWAFAGTSGADRPPVAPVNGETGRFDFAYTSAPASPATFSFSASYPAGLTGPQTFAEMSLIVRAGTLQQVAIPNITLVAAGANPGDPVAPSITTQPAAAAVNEGQGVTFSVAATGTAPLTYQWRKDGSTIAGATTPVYAISAATPAMEGSYTVVVANAAGSVTSAAAMLTVRNSSTAPQITAPPRDHTGNLGTPLVLQVVATSAASLPMSYQWRKDGVVLSAATAASLSLAGQASDAGSYTVVVSNAVGSVTSAAAMVVLVDPASPVTITRQPQGLTLAPGGSGVLNVGVASVGSVTYQWFKDGVALGGATAAELRLANATSVTAGSYSVEVSGGGARVRSSVVPVVVIAQSPVVPVIVRQPTSTVALAGAEASFTVGAAGEPAPVYQWRKNGTPIGGATAATLRFAGVQPADAGGYEVIASNAAGSVTSSLVVLEIAAVPAAPVFTRQPIGGARAVGGSLSLDVAVSGAPAPTFQWRRDGVPIAGATTGTLDLAALTAAQAGTYSVVATNTAGSVSSSDANVAVWTRNFAGYYFGSDIRGAFALYVRDDHTGVFLGDVAARAVGLFGGSVRIDAAGRFRFMAVAGAAMAGEVEVEGGISEAGLANGTFSGATTGAFSAQRVTGGGAAVLAGYYQAGAPLDSAQLLAIVSPAGDAVALWRTSAGQDAGNGMVDTASALAISTRGRLPLVATISADSGLLNGFITGASGSVTTFSGYREQARAMADQRIVNMSTRTTAGTGELAAIVGFVISGAEAKTVLVRAVGPTLAQFGVAGAVAAPRLEVLQGDRVVAANSRWEAGDRDAVAAAAARVAAFPLGAGTADAVVLRTLQPGAYTAVVSASDGRAGVGLIEVYDLTGGSLIQKLSNLSTRALAGAGERTLIAGVVVSGQVPKRMLVRAAGPALQQFGVAGALARPELTLFSGSTIVARNTGWSTGADAAAIAEAAGRVGAFAFAAGSLDAALLLNLPPGSYTAQINGAGESSGIALVEVYEVP